MAPGRFAQNSFGTVRAKFRTRLFAYSGTVHLVQVNSMRGKICHVFVVETPLKNKEKNTHLTDANKYALLIFIAHFQMPKRGSFLYENEELSRIELFGLMTGELCS